MHAGCFLTRLVQGATCNEDSDCGSRVCTLRSGATAKVCTLSDVRSVTARLPHPLCRGQCHSRAEAVGARAAGRLLFRGRRLHQQLLRRLCRVFASVRHPEDRRCTVYAVTMLSRRSRWCCAGVTVSASPRFFSRLKRPLRSRMCREMNAPRTHSARAAAAPPRSTASTERWWRQLASVHGHPPPAYVLLCVTARLACQ
jgi:hypothetical protein